MHKSKSQLKSWKKEINNFLNDKLSLELHPDKSKIRFLSKGVDFVGFRNFYYFKLPRKRNIKSMKNKTKKFSKGEISNEEISEIFQGWNAYAKWVDTRELRRSLAKEIYRVKINPKSN